ncbi:MAG: AmmeMemoRadiSam system protein B [Candidatus Heimdallarchaeota archaeon]|nr:AmmeMemoRadiSam system protein B [Candidatus Heimdallarchaeota archaeon]
MIREPAVAGSFYPKQKENLIVMIEKCFNDQQNGPQELPDRDNPPERKQNIFGLIIPHAGYIYSGPVAAHGFLQQYKDGKPDFFVIIGPNHRNIGPGISVFPEGKWRTPLGEAEIPGKIVKKIVKEAYFREDTNAHMMEHSIEIQLPFLQYLYGADIPIVPICLKDQSKDTSIRVGNVLNKVLKNYDYCLIASTDLTHYESQSTAAQKDQLVIEMIKNLNASGLHDVVMENHISMCGPGVTASVLTAALQTGIKEVDILKYATSGDVTGDKGSVVAYLSATLKR